MAVVGNHVLLLDSTYPQDVTDSIFTEPNINLVPSEAGLVGDLHFTSINVEFHGNGCFPYVVYHLVVAEQVNCRLVIQ